MARAKKQEVGSYHNSTFDVTVPIFYVAETHVHVATFQDVRVEHELYGEVRKRLIALVLDRYKVEWTAVLEVDATLSCDPLRGDADILHSGLEFRVQRLLVGKAADGRLLSVRWSCARPELSERGDGWYHGLEIPEALRFKHAKVLYRPRWQADDGGPEGRVVPLHGHDAHGGVFAWVAYDERLWANLRLIATHMNALGAQLRALLATPEGLARIASAVPGALPGGEALALPSGDAP